jgi:uncharacterized SAM-binding protein YcdF (DUF218 family)
MGFYLKKIISFWIEPFGLLLILLFLSIFFLFRNKLKSAKISLSAFLVLFLLFSYPPFVNIFAKHLEEKYEKFDYLKNDITYIHVLGHGNSTDLTQPISSNISDNGIKRVIEGVVIHKSIPNSKLVFTGYGRCTGTRNAVMNANLAKSLGVKDEDIIIGIEPLDTRMEAEYMKKIVKENEEFILVTSASHMHRAMFIFKSLGLQPLAAPTDFNKYDFRSYIESLNPDSIAKLQATVHEYLGILWVRILEALK